MVIEDLDVMHDLKITVTILDTQTGEIRQSPPYPEEWKNGGFSTYWWTKGNGSCDCNRKIVFDREDDANCESVRYRIIAVDPLLDSYTLDDFNDGYPAINKKSPA